MPLYPESPRNPLNQTPSRPAKKRNNPKWVLSLLAAALLLAAICWPPSPVLPTLGAAGINMTRLFSEEAHADAPVPKAANVSQSETTRIIDADLLRVGISDDGMTEQEYPEARISATGNFVVLDQSSPRTLYEGRASDQLVFRVDRSGFTIKKTNGQLIADNVTGPIRIEPQGAGQLQITNITRKGVTPRYHGVFEIMRGYSSPAKLSVVNIVSLQDYLQAVVPNELPARYGLQAVRAQAVAARNYAIRPREKPWPQFDICDSQYCQVYFGAHTETSETNRAISETQGQVALYDGEPILALFSSAHGGYGEAYSNAFSDPKTKQFPAPALAYLSGGPDVGNATDLTSESAARSYWLNKNIPSFDVDSPYYRWEKRWSAAEITATLNRTLVEISKEGFTKDFISPAFRPGQSIGTLERVNVTRRGVSGKAMEVQIVGSNGTWTLKKEFVIRKALSSDGRFLPSANVVFSHLTGAGNRLVTLVANGGGFGHGVGMSQLGASYMDKHGYQYPSIIQHYYRGVSIGSKPLNVGKDSYTQPVQTQFYADKTQGRLWVEATEPGEAVRVKLNGKDYTLDLPLESHDRIRGPLQVSDALKADTLNTLILYPDAKNPNRKLKAWVELYPPKAAGATASR